MGPPSYDDVLADRVQRIAENWPTLDSAYGCLNCRGIFRRPVNCKCPHCGSESMYDVAAALELERHVVDVERLKPLVEMLETVV